MNGWRGTAAGWALGMLLAAGAAPAGEKVRDPVEAASAPTPEVLEVEPELDEERLDAGFVRHAEKDPDRYEFPTKGLSFKPPNGYRLSAVNPHAAERDVFASFRKEDTRDGNGYFYFYEGTLRVNQGERNISIAKTVDRWRENARREGRIAKRVGGVRGAGRGWMLAMLDVRDTDKRARQKDRQGALSAWLEAVFVKNADLVQVRFMTQPETADRLMPAAREAIEGIEFFPKAREE